MLQVWRKGPSCLPAQEPQRELKLAPSDREKLQRAHAVKPDEDDVLVGYEGTVAVEEGRVGREEERGPVEE